MEMSHHPQRGVCPVPGSWLGLGKVYAVEIIQGAKKSGIIESAKVLVLSLALNQLFALHRKSEK